MVVLFLLVVKKIMATTTTTSSSSARENHQQHQQLHIQIEKSSSSSSTSNNTNEATTITTSTNMDISNISFIVNDGIRCDLQTKSHHVPSCHMMVKIKFILLWQKTMVREDPTLGTVNYFMVDNTGQITNVVESRFCSWRWRWRYELSSWWSCFWRNGVDWFI